MDTITVVHFHPVSVTTSAIIFKCGDNVMEVIDKYTYI